jgi:hypothetical protein
MNRICLYIEQIVGTRNAYEMLVRKPERKTFLGKPIVCWENNAKIYFKENGERV